MKTAEQKKQDRNELSRCLTQRLRDKRRRFGLCTSCGKSSPDHRTVGIKAGQTFGRLRVLYPTRNTHRGNGHYDVVCQCNCGTITTVLSTNLRQGYTNSCKCINREVTQSLHAAGLNRGENNYHARLTETNVREIRQRRRQGEFLKEIAAVFNVAPTTISSITNRQTWRHVA